MFVQSLDVDKEYVHFENILLANISLIGDILLNIYFSGYVDVAQLFDTLTRCTPSSVCFSVFCVQHFPVNTLTCCQLSFLNCNDQPSLTFVHLSLLFHVLLRFCGYKRKPVLQRKKKFTLQLRSCHSGLEEAPINLTTARSENFLHKSFSWGRIVLLS